MYPEKPPVWVDSTAVGMPAHSMPAAEIIGNATVSEHLPKQDISWIAATLFCIIKSSFVLKFATVEYIIILILLK